MLRCMLGRNSWDPLCLFVGPCAYPARAIHVPFVREEGTRRVRGGYAKGTWRVRGGYVEGTWRVRGGHVEGTWRVRGGYVEGTRRVRKGYAEGTWLESEFLLELEFQKTQI